MKKKWYVSYWDFDRDMPAKRWFDTYEQAVTFEHKTAKKFNSTNIKVGLRGPK